MSAFKAYDIRGIWNQDLNGEDVYKIGYFLPELLNTGRVLVGRDTRVSSEEAFESLTRGITARGADVYNLGLATTPMVYFLTAHLGFDASVMITASHNPREYNGLKVSGKNAFPVGYDTGLAEIERKMKVDPVIPAGKPGKVISFDKRGEYLGFLKNYIPDISRMKIAIDCSNGMAGLFIRDLLGNGPLFLYEEPDGTFPNHEANPLVEENVEDLKKLVLKEGCDIGVIFDGDADRVMFVDELGRFIRPDLMIAVLGHYFLGKGGEHVLQDIRTSKSVTRYIEKLGGVMHMWRVGRAYAAPKLMEINGIFGGELAGHYYFRDFYYSDSGVLACLLILDILGRFRKEGVTLSALIDRISVFSNSGEINLRIEKKTEAMEAVRRHFSEGEKVTAFYDFDGYRVEFEHWWFNIRPSNTEPYLRLLVEAENLGLLHEKKAAILKVLGEFS